LIALRYFVAGVLHLAKASTPTIFDKGEGAPKKQLIPVYIKIHLFKVGVLTL
jgi:hypothetical protein